MAQDPLISHTLSISHKQTHTHTHALTRTFLLSQFHVSNSFCFFCRFVIHENPSVLAVLSKNFRVIIIYITILAKFGIDTVKLGYNEQLGTGHIRSL